MASSERRTASRRQAGASPPRAKAPTRGGSREEARSAEQPREARSRDGKQARKGKRGAPAPSLPPTALRGWIPYALIGAAFGFYALAMPGVDVWPVIY